MMTNECVYKLAGTKTRSRTKITLLYSFLYTLRDNQYWGQLNFVLRESEAVE